MMMQSLAAGWVVAAVLVSMDGLWAHALGITIVGVLSVAGWIAVLLLAAIAYRSVERVAHRLGSRLIAEGSRRSAALLDIGAVVFTLSHAFVVLSYLVIMTGLPLVDEQLARIDWLLGFNWLASFDFLQNHRWLRVILFCAYVSTLPAMGLTLVYLSLADRVWRYHEMLWVFVVAAMLTLLISGFLPALHAPAYYFAINHRSIPDNLYPYLPDLFALRKGIPPEINVTDMKGIICFPSFHTVLVIIFCYALRRTRPLWSALVLGGMTILSLPTIGGHYLIDIPGGAIVAVTAILLVRRWSPKRVAQRIKATPVPAHWTEPAHRTIEGRPPQQDR